MPFRFDRLSPTGIIRLAGETVLLFLVAWAPWPFASVEPAWETVLVGGTVILAALWCAHGFFSGQLNIRPDAITACLVALILLTAIQLVPLPESVIGILSPTSLQLYQQLLPEKQELLPGEVNSASRPSWLTLTVDPFLTRVFFCQTAAVLLLYLVVRSWLASRESLRRLAWVVAINGILLAVLGLMQFFSSPRNVVFWTVETQGAVFGPFVCKNHYPDYILFCLGLGVGLLVSRNPTNLQVRGVEYKVSPLTYITDAPDLFVIGTGLIIVAVSVPFTLSRGGLIASGLAVATVVALIYHTRGRLTRGVALVGGLLLAALLVGGWFGWGVVSDRLSTLWSGQAADTRTELWANSATLIPNFLAAGGGNGAYQRFEPLTRTEPTIENLIFDNAHNEYLEAILEGGLLRFILTLMLCYFVLRTSLAAYDRLKDRSSGPLILGIIFGLVGLIVHSFVDFGIHMPAVAFMATVATAYAADAATDPTYVPYKKKQQEIQLPDPGRRTLTGPALILFTILVGAVSLWLLYEGSQRGQAYELQVAARDAVRRGAINQHAICLESLSRAVELTPGDAIPWMLLAQAHFDADQDERRTQAMALGGAPAGLVLPNDAVTVPRGERVKSGLAAARTARNLSPLLPRPHMMLGLYGAAFQQGEPLRTHFDRASRTCPTEPEIYLLRGNEAASRGAIVLAIEDWQKAMTLDPRKVSDTLLAARKWLKTEDILSRLLPAEPVAIHNAMEKLNPYWLADPTGIRKPYLQKLATLDGRGDWTSRGWAAIAKAHAELDNAAAAFHAWNKAIAKEPEAADLRDQFAKWLELDERYDEAEEQLLWLVQHRNSAQVLDRLDAVRHARNLRDTIHKR